VNDGEFFFIAPFHGLEIENFFALSIGNNGGYFLFNLYVI
jgi:hypothetical protein